MSNSTLAITDYTEKFQLDNSGWNEILQETGNFALPGVKHNVLQENDKINFNQWIFDVIRYVCTTKTDAYGFRVYVNGAIVNEDYLKEYVYPHIPSIDDHDGSQWIKAVFQDQKFGIILNYSEKFSIQIAERLSVLVQPLIEEIGVPSNGMHTTVFIGNYGFTPLGIHQDHFGANVIHFHLGPGDKTMYTWNEELFESINGGDKTLDEVLPFATPHHFHEGDLFFMPWDQYHIGRTDDVSIGLTVWFDNHSNAALFERILKTISLEFQNSDLKQITKMQRGIKNIDLSSIDTVFKAYKIASELSFKDLLKEVFADFKIALFSNCGWTAIPVTVEQTSDFKVDEDFGRMDNINIQVPYPFKLYHTKENEQEITIYARGSKITMKYHQLLIDIINRLNNHEVINTNTLLSDLDKEWPVQAGQYFIAMLYNKRAIHIVD